MMLRGALTLTITLLGTACDRPPEVTGVTATLGDLVVSDGVAWGLASSHSTTIGFRVTAGEGDTLIDVASPDGLVSLHDNTTAGMTPLDRLPVLAGKVLVLGAGGPHLMMTGTTHGYQRGDSVRLVLTWARLGTLPITVPLHTFSDAAAILGRP